VEETGTFSIRRAGGTIVVTVSGTIDLRQWSLIDRLLTDIIDAQGNLDVLLELGDVVSLERMAMPLIVDAARQARDHGGRLRLADRACREHRQAEA
jgi:anti-anti-sigma factor